MLSAIILGSLTVFILIYLFKAKAQRFSFGKPFLEPMLALIVLSPGLCILFSAEDTLQQAWDKKNWPAINGKVTGSEVAGERAFHPRITYSYIVGSKIYENTTDLKISGFGGKRSRRDTATRISENYTVNSTIIVRYNPDNPHESYIRIGPFWSDYMKLMVGIILSTLGLFFTFDWIIRMVRS